MKRCYYIFTPGKLRRKQDTIYFEPFYRPEDSVEEEFDDNLLLSIDSDEEDTLPANKKVLPVGDIEAFYIMTDVTFNARFLDFITKHNIPVHLFNYYGFYSGSYYPREYLNSGFITVRQSEHYLKNQKRMAIVRKFVDGAGSNLLRNLKYYSKRERDLSGQIDTIDSILPEIESAEDIPTLMNVEGRIRKVYYSAFNEILTSEMKFDKRKFHPPDNPVNALISFCNSLVYTSALSEIYRTQLNPTISYLHEPGNRRFSLALDIAEIFKPILADRIIFKLFNSGAIKEKDFEEKLNGCYLKDSGRKKVIEEFDNKMKNTIKHRELKREISFRRLIRLECYKLIKHLSGDKEYQPFKIWW